MTELTKESAKELIKSYQKQLEQMETEIKGKIAALGVKFQIPCYLGEYGSGQHLIINHDNEYLEEWDIGEWVSSSSMC